MMVCHGKCKPIPKKYDPYHSNLVKCSICDIWIEGKDIRKCPCCNSKTRMYSFRDKRRVK